MVRHRAGSKPAGRRRAAWLALAAALVTLAAVGGDTAPQRRGLRGNSPQIGLPWIYDGGFVFCRVWFRQAFDGDGNGWSVDYPRADLNFPFRLGELTATRISRDRFGEPNHVIVGLDDPHLFECPFVMMTEPGGVSFTDEEAARLREYLDKGGFLWADDFWGDYAWSVWEREIRKALPAREFRIVDVPMTHKLFDIYYIIRHVPQIPSINFWLGSGGQTSERYDSTTPHVRAIEDENGHIRVLMTHNTDFGDAFERETDSRAYFDEFAAVGYAFGINVFLYAMTH